MRRRFGIIIIVCLLIACGGCVGYAGYGYSDPYYDYYHDDDYYYPHNYYFLFRGEGERHEGHEMRERGERHEEHERMRR